jgi:acetoin utilization deacetylase AcuC-like enzyme
MIKVAWAPIYQHHLQEGHRFPMAKYSLLPEQLIYEGTLGKGQIFAPQLLPEARILRTHCSDYWKQLKDLTLPGKAQRKIGFPLSQQLIDRERTICQGTVDLAVHALVNGSAGLNIAGGTHHAYYDRGEGFCILNDIVIGAHHLIDFHGLDRILVVDLDVHQGNGTAVLAHGDDRICTFSMHGAKNYPYHKETSDWDIALDDFTGDDEYLALLEDALDQLFTSLQPQFVFFQSGVDVLKDDKLGRMGLSLNGCKRRDEMVFKYCKEADIPVVAVMGGGYSPEIKTIVEAHANTFRLAQYFFG